MGDLLLLLVIVLLLSSFLGVGGEISLSSGLSGTGASEFEMSEGAESGFAGLMERPATCVESMLSVRSVADPSTGVETWLISVSDESRSLLSSL
jgi:hypothetical protein